MKKPEFFNKKIGNYEYLYWSFVYKISTLILNTLAFFYFAKEYTEKDFADLNWVKAYALIVTTIAAIGLKNVIIKNLLKRPEYTYIIVKSGFLIYQFAGLILFFGAGICINFFSTNENYFALIIISLTPLLLNGFNVYADFFDYNKKIKSLFKTKLVLGYIMFGIRLWITYKNLSLAFYTLSFACEQIINQVVVRYFYKGQHISKKIVLERHENLIKRFINQALPLMFSTVGVIIYMKIDIIMLGNMSNATELANYSLATKLTDIYNIVPQVIGLAYFAKIAENAELANFNQRQVIGKIFNQLTILSLVFTITMFGFCKTALSYLFVEKFTNLQNLFLVYSISTIFMGHGVISTKILISRNLEKQIMHKTFVGCIINITLNYLLIPIYASYGAIFATLVSYFRTVYIYDFFTPHTRDLAFLRLRRLLYSGG